MERTTMTSLDNVLNPELICDDCQQQWTDEDEWIMDVFMCYDQQEYCLNCCGCPDHEGELWFNWKPREAKMLTVVLDEKWYDAVTKFISYWEPGEICSTVDVVDVMVDKDGMLIK